MDFSDALKAMKEGKKVRIQKMPENEFYTCSKSGIIKTGHYLGNGHIQYRESRFNYDGSQRTSFGYSFSDEEILAEDWEIVKDVPKVQLKQSTDVYFVCPDCEKYNEIIVQREDVENNYTQRECTSCGKTCEITNLKEMYNHIYNK